MKNYKDFVIVGIDHGYGNIKTANTVTPTGITKLNAEPTFSKGIPKQRMKYTPCRMAYAATIRRKWRNIAEYTPIRHFLRLLLILII